MKTGAIATAALALAVFPVGSRAATTPTAILSQPASPLRIDDCIAGTRPTGRGDYTIQNYYLDFAAVFTNRSSNDVSAVRLRFDLFNTFGEHLETKYGTDDAQTISAGAQQVDLRRDTQSEEIIARQSGTAPQLYLPTWEWINTADTLHSTVCSVDTVMFANGLKWQAPPPTASALSSALKHTRTAIGMFFKYEP